MYIKCKHNNINIFTVICLYSELLQLDDPNDINQLSIEVRTGPYAINTSCNSSNMHGHIAFLNIGVN